MDASQNQGIHGHGWLGRSGRSACRNCRSCGGAADKLARKDSASEGKHHYIGLDKVSSVQDGRVRLAVAPRKLAKRGGAN